MKPRPDKSPQKSDGFTWSRRTVSGGVTYNLFRRDHSRKLHQAQLVAGVSAQAHVVASQLRSMRRRLRDQVDEIDLRAMENAA